MAVGGEAQKPQSLSDGKGCGPQRWADLAVFCCLLTAQPQMQVQSQKSVNSGVQKPKFMAGGPKRGPRHLESTREIVEKEEFGKAHHPVAYMCLYSLRS